MESYKGGVGATNGIRFQERSMIEARCVVVGCGLVVRKCYSVNDGVEEKMKNNARPVCCYAGYMRMYNLCHKTPQGQCVALSSEAKRSR